MMPAVVITRLLITAPLTGATMGTETGTGDPDTPGGPDLDLMVERT